MFGKLFSKFSKKKAQPSEPLYEIDEEAEEEEEEEEVILCQQEDAQPVDGFNKTFGSVTVRTVEDKKKGLCLEAVNSRGAKILMEFYENDMADLPEGSNAYFFGNKLFIVTRWADMSDSEKKKVETADLSIALHPYPCPQVSLKIGSNWGDVIVNLYHCYSELNDENAPVDQAILIFADTEDETYLSCREVILPSFIQNYLQRCNANSHKNLPFDLFIPSLRQSAGEDPSQTFSDKLYDMCWETTRDFYHAARRTDLEDIPDGVYIEIDSANKVTKAYQNS